MKTKLSKSSASKKVEEFFKTSDFKPEEVKKIKRLAMKYRIPLREYRKKFCKSCLSPLKGKTRVTKEYKTIICEFCGTKNKFKIS